MSVNLSIAFLAGLISFLSPCVLPLIPGYVSYISGTTLDKINDRGKNFIIYKTIFFTLGFSFVFIALGSTASFIGKFFLVNSTILRIIAGSFIIFFSLHLIGLINLNLMNKELRFFTNQHSSSITFPFAVGVAFGFGWTPCIGPILGSILALAAIENNFLKGIYLLSFYSLGLAIPFIISGVLINKFLFFSKKIKKYTPLIMKIGGIILLLTGVTIITGHLQILGYFLLEYFPYMGNIG